MGKASQTSGAKPIDLQTRLALERERLLGMTDAERAYRKQYLLDQHLSPNEPREVPELYKSLHNPIRRAYRYPLDQLQKMLTPTMGRDSAFLLRYCMGKGLLALAGAYGAFYYWKYNSNTWMKPDGWRAVVSRSAVLPGDPGYPQVSDRSVGADYADRGFKKFTLDL